MRNDDRYEKTHDGLDVNAGTILLPDLSLIRLSVSQESLTMKA